MKNAISNLVTRSFNLFRLFGLKQVFVVALAGFLLLTSVACNAPSPSASGTGSYRERVAQPTNDKTYQPTEGEKSSYNDYGDRDTKALKAKSRQVIDRAKRNTEQVDDIGDFVDEIKSGAPNPAKDAGKVINQATDRASRDAKAGFQNLQRNIDKAGDGGKDTVREAAEDANQVSQTAQRNIKDAANFAKDKARDTSDAIQD